MIHIHYDFSLIVGSIILAILICYLAISIEQLLFRELFKKYKKTLLVISGFVLGAAIWCTHLVGILASQLPVDYVSDYRFIFVSYTPISTLNKLFKLNRRITTFFIHNDADRM